MSIESLLGKQFWFDRKDVKRILELQQAKTAALPDLPKPFRVEHPSNSEPFGLFTAGQMVAYRLHGRDDAA